MACWNIWEYVFYRSCFVNSFATLHNLFCFADTKGTRTNKNKKKNRRRKDQSKDSSLNNVNGNHNEVGTSLSLSLFVCMCGCSRMYIHVCVFQLGSLFSYLYLKCSHRWIAGIFWCFRSCMIFLLLAMMVRMTMVCWPLQVQVQSCKILQLCRFPQNLSLMMVILMMI